jgi:hypothetical protein
MASPFGDKSTVDPLEAVSALRAEIGRPAFEPIDLVDTLAGRELCTWNESKIELQPEVIWRPNPGPQRHLLACSIHEVFFGGARGGGKTDGMLGDFAQHAQLYGKDSIGVFFRRRLPQLEEVIRRSFALFIQLGARYYIQSKTWVFPNGAILKFRYLERLEDAEEYQGHSYSWMCFEEITQWPSADPINRLRATLRGKAPCYFRATGNPGGSGHQWVKQRYIEPCRSGYLPISDPETGLKRVYIPSLTDDNPKLLENDPHYKLRLRMVGSAALVKAWLEGDWDVVSGGYFDDVWSERKHVLRPFPIPAGWSFRRSFDWGSAKPSSCGFWAESNGVQPEGSSLYFPRGSLVRIGEYYTVARKRDGTRDPDVGLRLNNEQLGAAIAERSTSPNFFGGFGRKYKGCVADPSIWNDKGDRSIYDGMRYGAAKKIEGYNLIFEKADNERITGWAEMRAMLENALADRPESPGMWIFDRCEDWLRTVPTLQRDEKNTDDIDSEAEDHAADETRYAVMFRRNTGQRKRAVG